ncbi:MAG: hypothetical protein K0V04_12690 [Deltaproteobacteria bacterium]|nr:hypothetical protein [Deltaproteobacteria bacterium]
MSLTASRTLFLIVGIALVGPACSRATPEQCEAAFQASLDIAVNGFVKETPEAPPQLVTDIRAKFDKERRADYLGKCAKTTPKVAQCMAAAKTLDEQRECVPKPN